MTVSLTHLRVSTQADGGDPALIQPSDWNQGHVLTCASGVVLGRTTSGAGVVEEVPINGLIGSPGYYGVFQDLTTQTIASTTASYVIAIGSTLEGNGFSIVSGDRITAAYAGTYNVQFSIQFQSTDNAPADVDLWFRKNGADLTDSNSIFTIPAQHAGVNGSLIATLNYMLTLSAGDYIQIAWASNSTLVSISTVAAQTSPTVPETPGVIITVQQIMSVQAGPGVAAGGTAGQVLVKNSGTDYDTAWSSDVVFTTLGVTGQTVLGGTTGSEAFRAVTTASAVNRLQAAGATTGTAPILSAAGTDTNIPLAFVAKGTGPVTLATGSKGVVISNGGTVTAITRTAAGSGYTTAPTVTIAPPTTPGGVQATATCTITAGAVDATFTITNAGSGYLEQPAVTFSGGGGSGAAAYATVGSSSAIKSLSTELQLRTSAGIGLIIGQSAVQNANYIVATGQIAGGAPGIFSSGSDTNVGLAFSCKGARGFTFYTNTYSTLQLSVANTNNAVNYVEIAGSVTGAASSITAQGSDTNVDLALISKGTGVIKFGIYTTLGAETLAGYITIKDSGGTVRKLAVIA